VEELEGTHVEEGFDYEGLALELLRRSVAVGIVDDPDLRAAGGTDVEIVVEGVEFAVQYCHWFVVAVDDSHWEVD